MSLQLNDLAKLYLNGERAELSTATQQQLCTWLKSEMQQLPIAVEPVEKMPYATAAEMCADIQQGCLQVAIEHYNSSLYLEACDEFAFIAVHDYFHYLSNSDFSLEGEIMAYEAIADRAPSLEIKRVLYSEIVLKSAAHVYLGQPPISKLVLPEFDV